MNSRRAKSKAAVSEQSVQSGGRHMLCYKLKTRLDTGLSPNGLIMSSR